MQYRPRQHGFSLVELAIVLAIIGLLAGGITAGSALIGRAKTNKVITEINKYQTAYNKFKEIYQALPGDYVDATEQWGIAAGGTVDSYTASCYASITRTPKKPTCNGNGNNVIQGGGENALVWQHIADAGLVEGTFTGALDSAGGITPGENAPGGAHENGTYYIDTSGPYVSAATFFDQPRITELAYGRRVNGSWPSGGVLKPVDQYNIDTKIDDGKPAYGKVLSLKNACATTTDPTTAEYNRQLSSESCVLWMHIDVPVI